MQDMKKLNRTMVLAAFQKSALEYKEKKVFKRIPCRAKAIRRARGLEDHEIDSTVNTSKTQCVSIDLLKALYTGCYEFTEEARKKRKKEYDSKIKDDNLSSYIDKRYGKVVNRVLELKSVITNQEGGNSLHSIGFINSLMCFRYKEVTSADLTD